MRLIKRQEVITCDCCERDIFVGERDGWNELNLAQEKGWTFICSCGEPQKDLLICPACGPRYPESIIEEASRRGVFLCRRGDMLRCSRNGELPQDFIALLRKHKWGILQELKNQESRRHTPEEMQQFYDRVFADIKAFPGSSVMLLSHGSSIPCHIVSICCTYLHRSGLVMRCRRDGEYRYCERTYIPAKGCEDKEVAPC